jgi:hypothetical protein
MLILCDIGFIGLLRNRIDYNIGSWFLPKDLIFLCNILKVNLVFTCVIMISGIGFISVAYISISGIGKKWYRPILNNFGISCTEVG